MSSLKKGQRSHMLQRSPFFTLYLGWKVDSYATKSDIHIVQKVLIQSSFGDVSYFFLGQMLAKYFHRALDYCS